MLKSLVFVPPPQLQEAIDVILNHLDVHAEVFVIHNITTQRKKRMYTVKPKF